MLRWFLTIFIALILFSALLPWLEKLGVGRLPGDLRFTLFGKQFFLPFASTVLLSLIVFTVARLLVRMPTAQFIRRYDWHGGHLMIRWVVVVFIGLIVLYPLL